MHGRIRYTRLDNIIHVQGFFDWSLVALVLIMLAVLFTPITLLLTPTPPFFLYLQKGIALYK